MNTQRVYRYLALAALLGFWSCSSSRQTARNAGEIDDLYGNSASAEVYASNSSEPTRDAQRLDRPRRSARNANPDYSEDQQAFDANSDEYYSELSARKLKRGLSPDPGWNTDNDYNAGFVNGYYAGVGNPAFNAYRWNPWGYNNTFNNGLNFGLGLGLGSTWGWNRFGYGFGGGFYDPFFSPAYAFNSPFYSPFGYGYGGFYDSFYSPYYGGLYSPFYGGGAFGGWGRPVYAGNVIVTGADPYRNNRVYGARNDRSSARYNDAFVNTPRPATSNGGRRSGDAYYSSGNGTSASTNNTNGRTNSDSYYARPRSNSRGTYYYDNGSSSGGRTSSGTGTYTAPSYNSGNSGSDYYARPRSNSRGTYTPAPSNNGNSRGSYQQRQPSYQQPSYQQPSYQSQSRGSYSAPTPSYSAPAPSGGSRGGSSGSSSGGYSGGGGSRGPR